ncbi:MAG: YhfC family intramembrane metalloprotease [Caldilineaceae bacterium]|nr:YhfC family intramembrane metalloprotease [Caldilineaceae bacterium]
MNATIIGLLAVQLIVVIIGPLLLALWIRRRYGAAWSSLGWGALTFPLSQLLRIPLLLGTAALVNPLAKQWDAELLFLVNFVVLTITSGLFEEGARYLILRWAAKGVRDWKEGLMYGAGHGGIEAILIVGGSAISNIVLLATADTVLAQLGQMAPEQAAAATAQIDAVRALTWLPIALSVWERATAITLHIGLSLLVLLGVVRRNFRLVLAAMLIHALFNGVALIVLRYTNTLTVEIALTVVALLPLYFIWRLRPLLDGPVPNV